jgi:tetratricopeptide (TPR) repeat protein
VLVLGGALVFGGIYVFQRFVKPEGAGVADARVAQLLVASDASLSAGDVDEAKAQLDRASAFAENDPRLVRALARLELLRAEPAWLELRILAGDDASRGLVERRLKDALDRARRAVERAAAVDAQHPELALAQLDLKRLQGDVAGARGHVGGLGELASQPATLGSLGALDASEAKPDWPLAVERIGKAASAEGSLGRARAMLVYVFAASGDAKRARDELELLAKLPRPHVLEPALRRFVERVEKGGAVSIDQLPSASGSGAPSAGPVAGAGTAAAEAPSGGESPNVVAMRQAQEALGRGQMDAAERIYQGIVDKEPSNVEALTGLAQVARSRGQAKRAMAIYQRVLDANSTFLPALVSLADLKWDGGERSGAIGLYQRALAAGASGATADRARERSAPPSEPAPANTPPPSSGGESPPPAPRPDPAPEPPPPPPPPPPADVPAWEGDGKAPGGGP